MFLEMVMVLSQIVQVERWVPHRAADQEGQGLVEYALVLVLVAVVVIAILTLLGPEIGNVFSRIVCGLNESCA
jgi:pilus assembly protein Flp/PilA